MIGKQIYLEGFGTRVCEDTGGAIKEGRVDIYMATYQEALSFGKKEIPYIVL